MAKINDVKYALEVNSCVTNHVLDIELNREPFDMTEEILSLHHLYKYNERNPVVIVVIHI
jgi:hypothetical protein